MTRFHSSAQPAQRPVYPPDPFVARDRALELRSRTLSQLAGAFCAALARSVGRATDGHPATSTWQRR